MNGEELCLEAWKITIRDSPWTHNLAYLHLGSDCELRKLVAQTRLVYITRIHTLCYIRGTDV